MTEYDYSPEAYERHLAKQHQIAQWAEQTAEQSPANPFLPLPSEHPAAQTSHPYPQPAFYATPDGVISPTYLSSRKHGHHSPSARNAPSLAIPQGYRPVAARSFSTPVTPVRNYYSSPSTPYPYPTGSPYTLSPHGSPHGSPYHSPPVSHPSQSQSSFHSVPSHVQANPVMPQQPGGNGYLQPSYSQSSFHSAPAYPIVYQQPAYPYPQPQPVVVVRGARSYVVVTPPGQQVHVVSPQAQGENLFGKLMRRKSKKSKRSRRDSF